MFYMMTIFADPQFKFIFPNGIHIFSPSIVTILFFKNLVTFEHRNIPNTINHTDMVPCTINICDVFISPLFKNLPKWNINRIPFYKW